MPKIKAEKEEKKDGSPTLCAGEMPFNKPTRTEKVPPTEVEKEERILCIYVCPKCGYEHKIIGTKGLKNYLVCYAAVDPKTGKAAA